MPQTRFGADESSWIALHSTQGEDSARLASRRGFEISRHNFQLRYLSSILEDIEDVMFETLVVPHRSIRSFIMRRR
jgi:hypothetical protein